MKSKLRSRPRSRSRSRSRPRPRSRSRPRSINKKYRKHSGGAEGTWVIHKSYKHESWYLGEINNTKIKSIKKYLNTCNDGDFFVYTYKGNTYLAYKKSNNIETDNVNSTNNIDADIKNLLIKLKKKIGLNSKTCTINNN